MSKYLIVNADDYGFTGSVSDGIIQAHAAGIVSSTTVMINMPGVEAALNSLRAHAPEIGVGLHLNLTSGRPVSDAASVPSLVSPAGDFYDMFQFWEHADQEEDIDRELDAQFQKFRRLWGKPPDHLDSHNFISCFYPACFKAMMKISTDNDLPIRSHSEETLRRIHLFVAENGGKDYGEIPLPYSSAPGPETVTTDKLIVSFYDSGVSPEELRDILHSIQPGITELMCHPGKNDPSFADSYVKRGAELELLTDPTVTQLLEDLEIELTTFGQLSTV